MHSLLQWFLTEAVPAFGRTLVHSLWQGLAAAVLAGLVIAATRRSSAAKRYNGLVAIYALFLLAVTATFFSELSPSPMATIRPAASVATILVTVPIENGTISEADGQGFGNAVLAVINRNASLLAALWALLFAAQLTRVAFGLHGVQRMRKKGTQAVEEEWTEWVAETGRRLGIRRPVLLLQSARVAVPVALGFLKPVVLVPIGLMNRLTAQQVEAVLLHELAHIRRHDYLVNLLQSLADAVFFFNPAVRWISACIRNERETCCDDVVVRHTINRKGYVEALVAFGQAPFTPSLALAIGGDKAHLLNRVKTIVTRENSRLTVREQGILTLGVIALVTFGAFAFKPKEKEAKAERAVEKKLPVFTTEVFPANRTETFKALTVTPPSKPVADTLPKNANPPKWKNLNTNITDDGTSKTTQVIATEEDGTVYRIRKMDDEVVLLSVNGKEIAKENYRQYYPIIDAIEQARKQRAADAERKQQQQLQRLKQQQELLHQKQDETLQQSLSKLDEEMKAYRVDSLNRLNLQRTYEQNEKDYRQKERDYYKKERAYYQKEQNQKLQNHNDSKKLLKEQKFDLHSNPTVSAIISDLLANKMAENETKLSFNLTATELAVNGKPADKNVFEMFRKKYIRNDGDSYQYFRDGGTTRSTVTLQ